MEIKAKLDELVSESNIFPKIVFPSPHYNFPKVQSLFSFEEVRRCARMND